MSDVKVIHGNNRQFDLLAVNLVDKVQYHVEVSVTHQEQWAPSPDQLQAAFDRKYFGAPGQRVGDNTDFVRGKDYEREICETYRSVGLDPSAIRRVWVSWTVVHADGLETQLKEYCEKRGLSIGSIEILSFRDDIVPCLMRSVSTANYDDDVLRTLSLLQQYYRQTANTSP